MAGDWIKMRVDLADDPAVISIAADTGLDVLGVIGRLWQVWSWADQQLRDGDAKRVTPAWLDDKVKCPGFAEAMSKTTPRPWLKISSTGISIPDFEKHNGKPAKDRALSRNRMQRHRNGENVTAPSLEKRREVPINTPPVANSTAPPPPPAQTPVRTSTSTPRAAAHSTTATERQLAQQAEATRTAAAPPGGSVAAFVENATGGKNGIKPPDHFELKRANGEHPAHEGAEIPWWHSAAGIQARGLELGLRVEAEEPWTDFVAKVCATSGPGPWMEAQPTAVRDRIEFFQATGGAS